MNSASPSRRLHAPGFAAVISTPIGPLYLAASDAGLCCIRFGARRRPASGAESSRAGAHVALAARQLKEYFAGRRRVFDVPLDLAGTEKQLRIWRQLLAIPHGRTITYAELARRSGMADAPRAAGAACGANPVPVIVPCHRVIGSDGSLHGFGGGLWRKRALLELEGADAVRQGLLRF
jgi:methylated-DNA-[protein]-cysteine S-methyltransferase